MARLSVLPQGGELMPGAGSTREQIRAIAASDGSARERLVEDFIRERRVLFGQIARWLCRTFGVSPENNYEDFASMVSIEAYSMLLEQVDSEEAADRVENFEGLLRVRSRAAVRSWLDKDGAPAAGMSTALRRRRMLGTVRDELRAERGEEPTDQQVVEEHNARMHASRANPVKQGVLATVDDFAATRAMEDIALHDAEQPMDTDFVLHPTEGPKAVRLIVDRVGEANPQLGKVAHLWLGGLYRDGAPPMIGEVAEIAEKMGLSRSTIRTHIREIKAMAVRIVSEEFGITEADAA